MEALEGDGGEELSARRDRAPLAKRFTVRYLIALGIVATLLVWTIASTHRTFDGVEAVKDRMEAASAQPGRVHQIMELADTMAAAGEGGDRTTLRDASSRLQQEAIALRQVQEALVDPEGSPQLDIPPGELSPQLEELYFGSGRLDQRVVEFHSHAVTLASFDTLDDAPATRAQSIANLVEAEEELIDDLQQALSIYSSTIDETLQSQRGTNLMVVLASIAAGLAIVFVLFRPMARQIRVETSQLEEAERRQRENSLRQSFRNDLAKALEVCEDELEVLDAMGRAMGEVAPTRRAEVLMADEDGSHLRPGVDHPLQGGPGCPVDRAEGCSALRAGQTMVYESSRMLNVCPKLPQHSGGPCSAVCVPLMFNGHAIGVLHATGPENQPWDNMETERLKVLASTGSNRVGTIRITRATQRLASSDALTDLDNRRMLTERVRRLIGDETPFSVAISDLDHFKDLNDTYGHEVGDRALQLFAHVLRSQLRPQDVVARYGGEEFVIVLPETGIHDAAATIERLQVALAEEIRERSSVPFTASWGLTDSGSGHTFDEMLKVADLALYEAKAAGRNCLVVDGEAAGKAARQATRDLHSDPGGGADDRGDGADGDGPDGEAAGSAGDGAVADGVGAGPDESAPKERESTPESTVSGAQQET